MDLLQNMTPIKKLGKGEFGDVWLFQVPSPQFAVKLLKDKKNKAALEKEAHFLDLLKHSKFIVKGCGIQTTSMGEGLVMEYLDGFTLEKIFRTHQKKGVPMSAKQMQVLMYSVFKGLQEMHDLDIVHRDIKDENVFFTENIIKIIDLGFACFCHKKGSFRWRCTGVAGSPLFLAPEIYSEVDKSKEGWFDRKPPDYPLEMRKDLSLLKKADIWAAGALCWELISLEDPPNVQNVTSQADLDRFVNQELEGKIGSKYVDVIYASMMYDPKERSDAAGLLEMVKKL